MTDAEKRHMAEMERLRDAIKKTQSVYLKRDYSKRIRRMEKELLIYRALREKEG